MTDTKVEGRARYIAMRFSKKKNESKSCQRQASQQQLIPEKGYLAWF